jgi:hypothetical protein
MKLFDDRLPEEHEGQQQELLAMLRRAYREPLSISAAGQEQAIASVRERLRMSGQQVNIDAPSPHPGEDAFAQQAGAVDSAPLNPVALPTAGSRRRRIVTLLNGLAAVLVVGAIIGASALLFAHHASPPTGPASTPTPNAVIIDLPIAASSSAGGLTMSISMTPGPYFLSEMLEIGISLTNHAQKTFYVGLPFVNSACGYYTGVEISGGEKPYFDIPVNNSHSCPFHIDTVTLKPGQTLAVLKYLPLQLSGRVALTALASFYAAAAALPNRFPTSIPGPFGDRWPSAHIDVSPTIPANSKILFEVKGYDAIVHIPSSASGPLLYAYNISCQDFNDTGSTGSGNYTWDTLKVPTIRRPGCPGKNLQWTFAFAIPGYGVAVGSDNDPVT